MPQHDPSPSNGPRADPKISVVVPTYNRVDRLVRMLDRLAAQTVDRTDFEVIVISDGSTDGTDEFLSRSDLPLEVNAVRQPNAGAGAARNRGVAAARADLVLFVDDDVFPAPDLIEQHLSAHQLSHGSTGHGASGHPNSRVVIGPMLTPDDHTMSPWVAWEQAMLYKQYDAMNNGEYDATPRQFYTGNASLAREVFVESGGFDESLRRAEDVELAYRLADRGIEFHYLDAARGYHYAERSYESWETIAYDYGRNDVVFARRPGREWMAPFMARSFAKHHWLTRWSTLIVLRSKFARRSIVGAMRSLLRLSTSVQRLDGLARPALSIIYSIRFHEGVADELGGRQRFASLRRTGRIDPSWKPVPS